MTPMLAAISGEGLIKDLLKVFGIIICALIVWGLGRYFFPKLKMPAGGLMIWDGLFILLGALVLINFILGLFGSPLVRW